MNVSNTSSDSRRFDPSMVPGDGQMLGQSTTMMVVLRRSGELAHVVQYVANVYGQGMEMIDEKMRAIKKNGDAYYNKVLNTEKNDASVWKKESGAISRGLKQLTTFRDLVTREREEFVLAANELATSYGQMERILKSVSTSQDPQQVIKDQMNVHVQAKKLRSIIDKSTLVFNTISQRFVLFAANLKNETLSYPFKGGAKSIKFPTIIEESELAKAAANHVAANLREEVLSFPEIVVPPPTRVTQERPAPEEPMDTQPSTLVAISDEYSLHAFLNVKRIYEKLKGVGANNLSFPFQGTTGVNGVYPIPFASRNEIVTIEELDNFHIENPNRYIWGMLERPVTGDEVTLPKNYTEIKDRYSYTDLLIKNDAGVVPFYQIYHKFNSFEYPLPYSRDVGIISLVRVVVAIYNRQMPVQDYVLVDKPIQKQIEFMYSRLNLGES